MIKNEFKTLEKHIKELEALRRYPRVKQERDSLAIEVAQLKEKVAVLESEVSTHNELSSQLSKREAEINELAGKLAEELQARGFRTERRAFKPHVTLLRDVAAAPKPVHALFGPLRWQVRCLALACSEPAARGVQYRIIGEWPLTAAGL